MGMKRIVIVGSGNFGANAALYLAEQNLGHVTLMDSTVGLARGKALDLMEAAPIRGTNIFVQGCNDLSGLEGADVVILAADVSRKVGVAEEVLYKENLEVIGLILPEVKRLAPGAILMIQREPVAALTLKAIRDFGFEPRRVIGLTGLLETARFRVFMARALNAAPEDSAAMVIGGPGEHMIALTQFANLAGIPLTELLSPAQIDTIIQQTRQSDEELLGLLRLGPPYYAHAAALAGLVAAIVRDHKRYLPVTVYAQGQYGFKDVCLCLPALIGARGVEKILELELTRPQLASLTEVVSKINGLAA